MITRAPARAPATAAPRWKSRVAGVTASREPRRWRRLSIDRRRAAVSGTTRESCPRDPVPRGVFARGQRFGRRPRRAPVFRRAARLRARRAIVKPRRPAPRTLLRPGARGGGVLPRARMRAAVHLQETARRYGRVTLSGG